MATQKPLTSVVTVSPAQAGFLMGHWVFQSKKFKKKNLIKFR